MDTEESILGEAQASHVPTSDDTPAQVSASLCDKHVTPAADDIVGTCEFYYRPLQQEYVEKSGVASWEVLRAWATQWNPWDDLDVARRLIAMRDQLIIANSSNDNWSRHANFMVRHIGCGHQPPDYYVSYGYYYCSTYGTRLRPRLSAEGQDWLDTARWHLQSNIEDGLGDNMDGEEIVIVCRRYPNRTVDFPFPQYELEVNPDEFKTFAFKTHVPAYLDAGLADLPISDLVKIGGQPNIEEWLDRDTWEQAIESGVEVIRDKAGRAIDAAGQVVEQVAESARQAGATAGEAVERVLDSLTRHLRW
ncbi:hypothetical protein [Phytopseudomonas dryadis]|uniref:Uncharacterized protein n=1 Tax=Phytopseudomonas dryadis TaxID=2487520 RepID=A0A4V2KBR6_9GAMM|nr:hypothetical protein [Pseudomonas dryadis]TBU88435.1 hypothetical protein DNK44_18225 [Pseudomonas dryadis]